MRLSNHDSNSGAGFGETTEFEEVFGVKLESSKPQKPGIPILLICALVIWAGFAIYYNFVSPLPQTFSNEAEELDASNPIIQLRQQALDFFANNSGDCAGILQALVCGDRTLIKEDGTYIEFKTCGLAHIVAVSGAHLSIVTGMILIVLKKLRCSKKVTIALSVAFVLGYLVFTGIPISAIRSGVMVILAVLSGLFRRRANPLNALALALLFFIAVDPTSAVSISLFLSASSTLGILLFSRLFASWFPRRLPSLVKEPLSLTLSASISTLPFSVGVFSQLSTIVLFTNVIATPLFSIACVGGFLCAIFGIAFSWVPIASSFLGFVSFALAWPLKTAVHLMAQIPFASLAVSANPVIMVVLSVALAVALYVAWPKFNARKVLFVCVAITLALFVLPAPSDGIAVLDVGQGDAILIKSKGHAILVDTGNKSSKLRAELAKERIFSLDAVIITHHDDDHMGCLEDLKTYVQIGAIFSAEDALTCVCGSCSTLRSTVASVSPSGLQGLDVGDGITVGDYSARVVWPKEFQDEGNNADSLVLLVTTNPTTTTSSKSAEAEGLSVLLTGDAESEQLEQIAKKVGSVDVLKVGHHGSKVSLSDVSLNCLKPKVALISVGANNRYGHPTEECLQLLDKYGVKVFRTDENGEIKITDSRITCDF